MRPKPSYTKVDAVTILLWLKIISDSNYLKKSAVKLVYSKAILRCFLIGIILYFHAFFFEMEGQENLAHAQYSFKVRVLVAERTSDLAIKVKLTRLDGKVADERELGYEGTAIFDQLAPGQYLVTIEREHQATIARPLDIKAGSAFTISWELRISGNSTTVRETTKDIFRKESSAVDELSSRVSKKAFKAFQQASEESARGNHLKAVEFLQKAIKEAPNFFEAHNNLGAQHQKLKEPDKAIEAYERAIAIKRDSPKPFLNLGNIYLERKEWDSALKNFRTALDLEGNNLNAHLALGRIYLEKRDYGRAEEHLETVTRLDPLHNRHAFLALIQTEIMAQRCERAMYFLNSFLSYFPSDPDAERLKQEIERQQTRQ